MKNADLKLFLAPMEGVTDAIMRKTLSQLGGLDYCVTEFLRVTKNLHPNKIFEKHCPELKMGSQTDSGTTVYLQLLGGEAGPMADNAFRASELGAAGIDLNFGCPAKTVNRHDGGAVLLKNPSRLYDVTSAVRRAVDVKVPVSGKMRLGFEDPNLCFENALALQEAGVQWITVHCRTKVQGYTPPAHWEWIPRIQEKVTVPVIANGDIKCLETFRRCQQITGAQQFMIGRAALSNPFLFKKIKSDSEVFQDPQAEWSAIEIELIRFYDAYKSQASIYLATARTKQWLRHLSINFPQAKQIFQRVKTYRNPIEFRIALENCLSHSRSVYKANWNAEQYN